MTSDNQPSDSTTVLHQQLDVNFTLQATGIGVWEYNPGTGLVNWDRQARAMFGIADGNHTPYEQAIRHIHPDDVRRVDEAVQRALNPQSDGSYDQTYRTIGVDDGQLRWVRFVGRSYFTESGELCRFAGIAHDITEQTLYKKQLTDQRTQLYSIIQQTPAPTLVVRGDAYHIDQVNEPMLAFMGWGEEVIGQPLLAVMPERTGQFAWQQVQRVYEQGIHFNQSEIRVPHVRNGVMQDLYYDVSYRPLREAEQITGVIQVAIDVTEQVLARRAIMDKEAALSNAIELAELGTFSVDIGTNLLTASPRVADWFGFDSLAADAELFIAGVGEGDREHVRTSLYGTLLPGSDGRYDVIHSVVNAKTGHRRILHALGRVFSDANGKPVRIEGTAQDITVQRELQLLLEQQVQQRTDELAATNSELATSNGEYAAINEKLEKANNLLTHSNENLKIFAYIASHDLQEPLRKIQQFGDLLKHRLVGLTGVEELSYLERMQLAAGRMSILIKDLLSFSRVSTQHNTDEPVALQAVVDTVLSVLDWSITETGGQILVDTLPTVRGDAVQLGQLFQNLVSNALKFHQAAVPLTIRISSQTLPADQLPTSIVPARRAASYYRIDVADNGIGFDEKYLDRIFQVFQRLHGKSQYEGTGVGLAICEKVVVNHGGAITATSQPGQGATFMIYLPAD